METISSLGERRSYACYDRRSQEFICSVVNLGPGKTSFMRYLIRELKSSHRFYFLPSYEYSRVGNSELIDFFHAERDDNPNCHFVVVMEDAEAFFCCLAGEGKTSAFPGCLTFLMDCLVKD